MLKINIQQFLRISWGSSQMQGWLAREEANFISNLGDCEQ